MGWSVRRGPGGLGSSFRGPGRRLGERRTLAVLGTVGSALTLILAAFFLGRGLAGDEGGAPLSGSADGALAQAAAGRAAPSGRLTAPPWDGRVRRAAIGSASAECTAEPSVDAGGRPVGYAAGNMLDGARQTAWRCDGDGRGVSLRFALARPTLVAAVGLIPGYAKTDPFNGVDRYAQNRRIARVRWTFGDGTWVEQTLDTRRTVRRLQTVRIPPVRTRLVRLTIEDSVPAGRDTVAVSTVRVATPVR
jgi:hypothetical protein